MDDEPLHPIQIQRFREMTFAEKCMVGSSLLHTARTMRCAAFRSAHPDWSESEVNQAVARELTQAHT